jgi:hypothetical protein
MAEHDGLGNLPQRHTEGVGRLLRGAGSGVEHHRRFGMAQPGKRGDHALHGVGRRRNGRCLHDEPRFSIRRGFAPKRALANGLG